MPAVRVRLLGGALNGHVLWVEQDRPFLEVHVAGSAGVRNTLRYQIDGSTGQFVSESATGAVPDVTTTGKV